MTGLNPLTLYGGGVPWISTLYILKELRDQLNVDGERKKSDFPGKEKPCEVLSILGGSSTSGLGRSAMDLVDECITAYTELEKTVPGENPSPFLLIMKNILHLQNYSLSDQPNVRATSAANGIMKVGPVTDNDKGKGQYEPTVDIVAIHGLSSHGNDTWCKNVRTTEAPFYVNWPKDPDMLPSVVPEARILCYDYSCEGLGKEAVRQWTSTAANCLHISWKCPRKAVPRLENKSGMEEAKGGLSKDSHTTSWRIEQWKPPCLMTLVISFVPTVIAEDPDSREDFYDKQNVVSLIELTNLISSCRIKFRLTHFVGNPSSMTFGTVFLLYFSIALTYHRHNKNDTYQNHLLAVGAFCGIALTILATDKNGLWGGPFLLYVPGCLSIALAISAVLHRAVGQSSKKLGSQFDGIDGIAAGNVEKANGK